MESQLEQWRETLENMPPEMILAWAVETFGQKLILGSAMGPEAQILTHFIASEKLGIPVFTVDTGRVFEETYDLISRTNQQYNMRIRVFFPDQDDVETLAHRLGPNPFLNSVEDRKECCAMRKVFPLERALEGMDAWITGLRRDQSITRGRARVIEWDAKHGMVKINPLVNWSSEQVWSFIKTHNVPYNELHDKGFPSIGCKPCTRATQPGEDIRAGRWWWEEAEHRECGIHIVDGRVMRKTAEPPIRRVS